MAKDLKVRLLGDDSDLQKTFNESAKKAAKWSAAMVAAAAAASAAIFASASSQAKELSILSTAANTTVSDFQQMAFAARRFGIEQDKLGGILQDFNDRIGDFNATGAGPMVDFFEQIAPKVGITADSFKELSGAEALQLYVSTLEKANLSQADMVFFMETMASDSTRLIPLLTENGKQLQIMSERADALGLSLSDIDAETISRARDSISEMGDVVSGVTQQLALQFAPVIDQVSEKIVDSAISMKGFETAAQDAFDFSVAGAGALADSFHIIKIGAKAVELAYDQLKITAVAAAKFVIEAWDDVGRDINTIVNETIKGLNNIPGVDLNEVVYGESDALREISIQSQLAMISFRETRKELNSLISEDRPSIAFEQFIKDAKEAAEQAAKVAVEARKATSGSVIIPETQGLTKDEQDLADKQQKELESRLERIRLANLTEQEIATEKLEQDLVALAEGNQLKLLTDEEYLSQKMSLQKRFDDDAEAQAKAAADKQIAIETAAAKAKLNVASSAFGNLSSLMNTENKKLFEIGKVAALAQATIDGYSAIQSSYAKGAAAGGPVLGAAFAATAAVATAVQISGIASTSFGSGGGSISAPSGGTPSTSEQATSGGAGSNDTSRSLIIQGDFSSDQLFTGDAVRNLMEQIAEQQADGYKVVI